MYRENKLKCQQIIDCDLITCNTSYHLNSNMSWNCINKILELLNVYIKLNENLLKYLCTEKIN